MKKSFGTDLLIVAVGALILVITPFIGVLPITPSVFFEDASSDAMARIFWELRFPRVVAGFLVGGSLAFCGVVFQALFHNPLASPFTLGISSGAAFGAALAIVTGLTGSYLGLSGASLYSMAGALITVAFVYVVGRDRIGSRGTTMLLAGVVINFFFGSLVVFLQYISDVSQLFSLMRWLMGSLEIVGSPLLLPLTITLGGSVLWLGCRGVELDLISLGDELAVSRGIDIAKRRRELFVVCSLLIALAVTLAGPIGFIGIIIPHGCRIIGGPSHRTLLIRSVWVGGIALVACDALGRSLMPPAEIPVGVVTALIGAPLFIALLFNQKTGGNIQ